MSLEAVRSAPGRPWIGRPGVVLVAVLLLSAGAACERGERARVREAEVLVLEEDTVRLAPGAAIVETRIRSSHAGSTFEPDTIRARPGDVVRFVAADARNYAIAFDAGSLAPEARAYLERTGQLRGPPLLTPGATWIVSLEGAPPGLYPFACLAHGARGLLIVGAARTPAPSS
jgi:plastocyanin